jgi:arylsulfatase A-like enzyme
MHPLSPILPAMICNATLCNASFRRLVPWLAALLLCGGQAACAPRAERVVVLISLDTLRADHLGFEGYRRDTSPNLDAFARDEAVAFVTAYAQSTYTLPSHMSIMTGLYPEAHGVLTSQTTTENGTRRVPRLSSGIATLAEILATDGFATTAFTDGLMVDGRYGFDRGFDDYRDLNNDELERNGFRKFRDAVRAWISEHSSHDFFLFLHTYDTHSPYVAPEPFRSRFTGKPPGRERPSGSLVHASMLRVHGAMRLHQYPTLQHLIDAYDGGIAYVDHEVGALFAHLKREGLWDQSLIIITSDHGELFLENNLMIGHGLGAYNEEVRIPLLIKFPGSKFAGRRVDHVVESIDLLPTILAALGLRVPEYVQGQNLLAGIERDEWSKRHAFGVSPNSGYNHYLLKDGFKFIGAVEDPYGHRIRGHFEPKVVDEMVPPPVDGFEPNRGRDYWEKRFYSDIRLDSTRPAWPKPSTAATASTTCVTCASSGRPVNSTMPSARPIITPRSIDSSPILRKSAVASVIPPNPEAHSAMTTSRASVLLVMSDWRTAQTRRMLLKSAIPTPPQSRFTRDRRSSIAAACAGATVISGRFSAGRKSRPTPLCHRPSGVASRPHGAIMRPSWSSIRIAKCGCIGESQCSMTRRTESAPPSADLGRRLSGFGPKSR